MGSGFIYWSCPTPPLFLVVGSVDHAAVFFPNPTATVGHTDGPRDYVGGNARSM